MLPVVRKSKECPWVPNVPSLSTPPWRRSNFAVIRARNRTSIQTFSAVPRPVQPGLSHHPASSACFSGCAWLGLCLESVGPLGSRQLLSPCGCRGENARRNGVSTCHRARERRSNIFSGSGYTVSGLGWTGSFFRITNFPSFCRLLMGPPPNQYIA